MDSRAETRSLPPLRAVRQAQGRTLRETARRAQIDPGHLSRVERGQESLSIPALARLARVLGLTPLADLLAQYVSDPEDAHAQPLAGREDVRVVVGRGTG